MSEQIQKVGNYILLEKLAVGGMAEVYLSKMISSERLVAIKKVLSSFEKTTEYAALFEEEVKVSLSLRHGNIVGFVDYIHENNQLYLVMEFVNGLNLKKLVGDLKLKKTKLNLAQCLHVIAEAAAGLDHAHRAVDFITNKKLNVIHRDINPHNIMITFDGCVKIIDFGIAKSDARTNVTKFGTIKGKFSYMSPEQAAAKPIDARADIYALGVVMWELLLGQRLHEGKNDLDTLKKIRVMRVPPPNEVDPRIPLELNNIVMKALEREPEDRYQRAADFRFSLNQYLAANYPEFRPSDFSDFISGMYSELIKSRVEKLVYFSKVKVEKKSIGNQNQEPPVVYTGSQVESQPGPNELPEGFEHTEARKNGKLDFGNLKKESNIFAGEVKTQTKQKAAQFFSEAKTDESERTSKISLTRVLENSFLWNLKHFALMIIVIYAGLSFYKQVYNPNFSLNVFSLDQSSKVPAADSAEASVAAEIDQKTNAGKTEDFSSKVLKEMKESGKVSYANIGVQNGVSSDTNIFIDGKLIYQKAPIRRWPIIANRLITITAYNPKAKTYDEKKLVLQSGRTVNVNLVLRPYKVR